MRDPSYINIQPYSVRMVAPAANQYQLVRELNAQTGLLCMEP